MSAAQKTASVLSALALTTGVACDDVNPEPPPPQVAQDGIVLIWTEVSLCEKNLDNSGYGVCGRLHIQMETWTGEFNGILYDQGEEIVPEDLIDFVVNRAEFSLSPDSPDAIPRYTLTFQTEAVDWPVSFEVSGFVDAVYLERFLAAQGTMALSAFGEDVDITLTQVDDGGSEPEAWAWLEDPEGSEE